MNNTCTFCKGAGVIPGFIRGEKATEPCTICKGTGTELPPAAPQSEEDNRSNPLINAARGRDECGINLNELERDIDDALEKETPESLRKFIVETQPIDVQGEDNPYSEEMHDLKLIISSLERQITALQKQLKEANARASSWMDKYHQLLSKQP